MAQIQLEHDHAHGGKPAIADLRNLAEKPRVAKSKQDGKSTLADLIKCETAPNVAGTGMFGSVDRDQPNVDQRRRALILTDSASFYSSIMSGRPKIIDRRVRAQPSFVLYLFHCLSVTFVDEAFNLAYRLAKSYNGSRARLRRFLLSSFLVLGFSGRNSRGGKQIEELHQ